MKQLFIQIAPSFLTYLVDNYQRALQNGTDETIHSKLWFHRLSNIHNKSKWKTTPTTDAAPAISFGGYKVLLNIHNIRTYSVLTRQTHQRHFNFKM